MRERHRRPPRGLGHHAVHDEPTERSGKAADRVGIDAPGPAVLPAHASRQLSRRLAHPEPLLAGHLRLVGQHIDDRRIESLLEQREQLGADAVARDRPVAVGLVGGIGNLARFEVLDQRAPPAIEQRADEHAAPRMHGRQALRAGAPQQSQKKRFGLIVARVAERHDVRAEVDTGALEEFIPRRTRRVFD